MNDSGNERLAALAGALARLERRQEEILRRLERLEARGTTPPPRPPGAPPPVFVPPAAPAPAPPAPQASGGLEARMGLTWVNRIGVVTLLLGAAFFFKYASDSGWIGVWTRVLIGAAAGAGAVAVAERVRRLGHRVYAQGMAAAGIGILYLTVYAACAIYGLIPQGAAFALMALVTAAAAWLSLRHASVALAVLGLAGGYATPLLLGAGRPPWFVLAYALLLEAAALYLSRARAWWILEALAVAGTAWLYGAQAAAGLDGRRGTFTVFLFAYWLLAAAAGNRWTAAAAQALASFAAACVWLRGAGGYYATAWLLAAGGLAAARFRRGWPLVALAAFWVSHLFWAYAETHPDGPVFWFLTAVFLLFFAWLPWRACGGAGPPGAQDLVLLALNAALYFTAGYFRLARHYAALQGVFTLALAAPHAALACQLWNRHAPAALFTAAVAAALLVLAALVEFSGFRITQVWALEAAALAWIGARLQQSRAWAAGLAVFALTLIRLLFVDTRAYRSPWDYSPLVNARFFTFLLAAACCWAAAWWGRAVRPAMAAYVAGHFVLLWGLALEALGWAARASAANPENAGSAAVSILMAAYALALVGAGVWTATAANRALGLGLIGVVVAKLYLYDVWWLGLFYRMAAFAALGVLLLVMSFLYSRRQRRAG